MKAAAMSEQQGEPVIVPNPGGNLQLLAAICRVMQKVGYVQKGGENEFHHYKYATEADTIAALRPVMLAEGLIMTPSLWMQGGVPQIDTHGNVHIIMSYTLHHVPTGQRMVFYVPASGNDRSSKGSVGDKGIYKAMTGALKYALRQTFMLETGDDPEEGNEIDKGATSEQEKTAHHLLKVANTLIEGTTKCDSEDILRHFWNANLGNIDLLRKEHADLHKKVVEAFKLRKNALALIDSTNPDQP